jgi:hypothetical protein
MNRTAAGVFDTYAAAGKVVQELELLGISGEQVEVVSDAAHDARGEGVVPESSPDGSDSSDGDYTLVIVRPSDDVGMEQTKNLMDRYGAKLFRWQISADGAPGDPAAAGADSTDIEGCGRQIDVHGSDRRKFGRRKSDRNLPN